MDTTAINEFLTEATGKQQVITEIISGKKSESTASFYFILRNDKNDILNLAISDHSADNHMWDFSSVYDDDDSPAAHFSEISHFFDDNTDTEMVYEPDIDESAYYSVSIVEPYQDLNVDDLIGKPSLDRAFVVQDAHDCFITNAKLLDQDRILEVTYANDEVVKYVDYLPSGTLEDTIENVILIQYVLNNTFNTTPAIAKQVFYNDIFFVMNESDYLSEQYDYDPDAIETYLQQDKDSRMKTLLELMNDHDSLEDFDEQLFIISTAP